MSEPYQLFVLIPEGLLAQSGVRATHTIILDAGGVIDEDSTLVLNNSDEKQDMLPTFIVEEDTALDKLSMWPTLGSISYSMPEGMATVSYLSTLANGHIYAIEISVLPRAFERSCSASNWYCALGTRLHNTLRAKRTIFGWGLDYKGFDWDKELSRLNNSDYFGTYSLLDLGKTTSQG
ncbi:MAG: hypothetical protein ACPG8W_09915 [Candidatus Promineifilaceae bacterium]